VEDVLLAAGAGGTDEVIEPVFFPLARSLGSRRKLAFIEKSVLGG